MKLTKYILTLLIINYTLLIANCFSQQWRVFTTSNSPLPSNLITSIVVDTNNIKWAGTDNGLVKIEGNNWTIYDTNNTPLTTNIIIPRNIDKINNLWLSQYSKGAVKFDGVNWTIYNTTNSGLPSNSITCITIDNDNVKWIGPGGVAKFNDINWIIYNTINSGLPSNIVLSIAIEDHVKWIGTNSFSGGMAKFNDTNWVIYNTGNSGIPSNLITIVKIDAFNYKWICTEFGGLAKFNSTSDIWTVFNTGNSGIPSNNCYGFVSTNHIKYVSTDFGIGKYNDTIWQVFNTSNSPLPSNTTSNLAFDKLGNLWIPTANGLAIYNPNNIIGINTTETNILKQYKLHQNYPNPFNPKTKISYDLSKNTFVNLTVYNIEGKAISILVNKNQSKGTYTITFESNNLPSGIYFYKLITGNYSETKKMILIK